MNNNSITPDFSFISFEEAFARLEVILEQMNAGAVTLDDSLTLYEEANQLITLCNRRLNEAEKRIEILVKNRQGELVLNAEQKPITQDYPSISS